MPDEDPLYAENERQPPEEGDGSFVAPNEGQDTEEIIEEPEPDPLDELISGPYTRNADGSVDCTMLHPRFGEVPFTARGTDPVGDLSFLVYQIVNTRV